MNMLAARSGTCIMRIGEAGPTSPVAAGQLLRYCSPMTQRY
jgi:hypothetical protein